MKTLGKASSHLITTLYDENKTIFMVDDIIRINKVSHSTAAKLVFDMIKRKVIFRLKKGKYIIIPLELGSIDRFIGNWFVAAREVANSLRYYIAFYSAMKYWGMVTQPLIKIFVATPKRQITPREMRNKIVFVYADKKSIWGINEEWVTKTEKVKISNLERTILDTLAHCEYCGGITEVAKGIWLVKEKINFRRLMDYTDRYGKNVVAKRLGYILEVLNIGQNSPLMKLKKFVKDRYDLFDPTIEKEVVNKNKWRLIDNVGQEQILKVISY